jgi:hypothetical protein
VGVALPRLLEAVGNGLAHAAEGDVLERGGGAGGRGSRAADGLLDVLLSDLAALASALEAVDLDATLAGQTLGLGADVGLTVQSGLELAFGWCVLLGRGGRLGGRLFSRRGLRLGLLLGGGSIATGILKGELLKGGNITAVIDENGNGLDEGRRG